MALKSGLQLVAIASGIALLAPATFVSAQPRPLGQKQISRGVPSHVRESPPPRTPHLIYGTLTSVRNTALVLHTRHGNNIRVDAAAAVAAGTYSAPFFVGKVVVVGGYFDAMQVLHASSVMRLTRLDPTTNPDR